MYSGFKVNTSLNKTIVPGLGQTQLETLQREVDSYTRKLEQQKRKYFNIQDTYKAVSEQYEREKSKLNLMKKENGKAHNVIIQSKIKNLQANLDKAISTFDDTVAQNNKLKGQIDMLRRQKKNYVEMQKSLEEQIHKFEQESSEKLALIEKKKKKAQDLKDEIIMIKMKNQQERQQYLKEFDQLQKEYMHDKRDRQTLKFDKGMKLQTVDTQPLLKHRLKRIIGKNKQKLKMIDEYKKHMKMIEQAFEDIRKKSGIESLDQITNNFIKSEQQNYSLYNYMDSISQNIDVLKTENQDLEKQIQRQKKFNEERRTMLNGTPQQEKRKQQLQAYIIKKENAVKELDEIIQNIKPALEQTLLQLGRSSFNDDPNKLHDYELAFNINERTIQQYLSDLEKYINTLMFAKQQIKPKAVKNIKDNATSYSKPIPFLNYQQVIKDKQIQIRQENKFIEQNKLREYAAQYWQRRKNKKQ